MSISRNDLSGRKSLLAIPLSVGLAVALGILGVPGTTHSLLIGALAVALPVVINFLNPADSRYGRGKETPSE